VSHSSPFVIVLSDAERAELERRARCYTLPYAEVGPQMLQCGAHKSVQALEADIRD
jgi:hypothetical protein